MTGLDRGPLLYPYRSSKSVGYRNRHRFAAVSGCRHSTTSSFATRCRNTSLSPTIAGDVYPVPFGNSQISGGGSVRLSLVSADTPLCDGPRKEGQSLVTAFPANGLGRVRAGVCPSANLAAIAVAPSACNAERREIVDISGMLAHYLVWYLFD